MKFDGEVIATLFVLLILGALVGGILYMLGRFWGECTADTAHAQEWVSRPTTTVQATLFDTSFRWYGKHSYVIGQYS